MEARKDVLKQAFLAVEELRSRIAQMESARHEPVAIVGLSCRLPGGADTPERFWDLLRDSVDAIIEVPPDRWDLKDFFDPNPDAPGKMYTRWGSFLDRVDEFDAGFFRISGREALTLDPQQRLLLETSWEALERAGYPPAGMANSRTGVFIGISTNDYSQFTQLTAQFTNLGLIDAYTGTGSAFSVAAGRLSHAFGFQGPSFAIDTACSSSLVTVDLACQHLRSDRCDLALAGGVNVLLSPCSTIYFSKIRAMAADGRCKTFDASADGYVRGEGCGVVVLKRLSDALRDRDNILAVIRGSAVNHDGPSSGLTVPNAAAQRAVILAALADAGLRPEDVDYIEAHGTGTPLGDPIELGALGRVFGPGRQRPLIVGSVKTNIGHLEAAAGIAGLAKLVLSLGAGEIPAHLHFQRPNPHVRWEELPLEIPRQRRNWERGAGPRRGGVSSFGFGGTNAHVVVEEAPPAEREARQWERPLHLLCLSARSEGALDTLARSYAEHLERHAEEELGDVVYTAHAGRSHLGQRMAVIGKDREEMAGRLRAAGEGESGNWVQRGRAGQRNEVVFLFPGQGSQYSGMCRELYESQPVVREVLERAAGQLEGRLEGSLWELLWGEEGEVGERLVQTGNLQPVMFAVEWALVEMWGSWGIEPGAVLGHSLGEYGAACAAGVLKWEEGLELVWERARLMQEQPGGGAMAAVYGERERVEEWAWRYGGGQVGVAADNGPGETVLSGERGALERVLEECRGAGMKGQHLKVSHAFHSARMEPVLERFGEKVRGVKHGAARIGLLSNWSGDWVEGEGVDWEEHWKRQMRQPVEFRRGMERLVGEGYRTFVEVGPQTALLGLGRRCAGDVDDCVWLPSLRRGRGEWQQVLETLGRLYTQGAEVDWKVFDRGYGRRRVILPTYPFERQRHWVEGGERSQLRPLIGIPDAVPLDRTAADCQYEMVWQTVPDAPPAGSQAMAGPVWVLFLPQEDPFGARCASRLKELGATVLTVRPGAGFEEIAPEEYRLNPLAPAQWIQLLEALGHKYDKGRIRRLVLLPGMPAPEFLCLLQVLPSEELSRRVQVHVITRGLRGLASGGRQAPPDQAPVGGLARVAAIELPQYWGGLVDIDSALAPERDLQILYQVAAPRGEDQVAFSNGNRFVLRARQKRFPDRSEPPVRQNTAYALIGPYGPALTHLAQTIASRDGDTLFIVTWNVTKEECSNALAGVIAHCEVVVPEAGDAAEPHAIFDCLTAPPFPIQRLILLAPDLPNAALRSLDPADLISWIRQTGAVCAQVDRAAGQLKLEAFIALCSVESWWGGAGAGANAACHHYIDAFCAQQRARGVPATVVSFASWGGLAQARNDLLRHHGLQPLPEEWTAQVIESAIANAPANLQVALADWSVLKRSFEAGGRRPWLETMDVPGKAGTEREDLVRTLAGLPERECFDAVVKVLQAEVATVLGVSETPPRDQGFFEMGIDSLMAVELRRRLESWLGQSLPSTLAFDYPNIGALSRYVLTDILKLHCAAVAPARPSAPVYAGAREPVAIVGMACRFPGGANDLDRFWSLLHEGRSAVVTVPPDRWDADLFYDPDPDAPGKSYVRHASFLQAPVDQFDAQFFGVAPREAAAMDPQQRLMLELCWEGLENAAQPIEALRGTSTGVFLGINTNDYIRRLTRDSGPGMVDAYTFTGNTFSVAAGRVSHLLGLQGPSLAVDTSCSSSLVALHLAAQSVRSGECDIAIAGGVNLMLTPDANLVLCRMRALAPDGRCKTFDAAADGYARGEGGGVVVLKRLSAAMENRDRIYAVLHGCAVNHDGPSGGLTVPNGGAQQAVIRAAVADAGIVAEDIGYLEAHGTGTILGDPIEMEAVRHALCARRGSDRPLWVGTVKTNIGHLEAAAGIAGMIKAALCLHHGEIPAHLHFENPSPHISWNTLPVKIPREPVSWGRNGAPRYAGVSSFGMSGTNVHAVLGEAPQPDRSDAPGRSAAALTVSAKTAPALVELACRYAQDLRGRRDTDLDDFCFTANAGRSHWTHRLAVTGSTRDEIAGRLETFAGRGAEAGIHHGIVRDARPKVAFLFSGQGAQFAGMGKQLYRDQPIVREFLDRCQQILATELQYPLLEVMFEESNAGLLNQTQYTQPAVFALDLAVAEMWRALGIEPAIVMGHSLGEYAAATIAGVFSLEDALRLVVQRARLMDATRGTGAMAAIFAPLESVTTRLVPYSRQLSVAAVNGPAQIVISGDSRALDQALLEFEAEGIRSARLRVSHAFHSPLMEEMLDDFEAVLRRTRMTPPALRIVSNLTGRIVSEDQICEPSYWRRHVREPVMYRRSIETLCENDCNIMLEVGPGTTLSDLGQECAPGRAEWVASLRSGFPEWLQILDSLGALHVRGCDVNWRACESGYERRPIALPGYPFQRKRHWIDVPGEHTAQRTPSQPEYAGWLHEIQWISEPAGPPQEGEGTWLVLSDRSGAGERLARALEQVGDSVIRVFTGRDYQAAGSEYQTDPSQPEHFGRLLEDVRGSAKNGVRGIVHCWTLDAELSGADDGEAIGEAQVVSASGVLHMLQAVIRHGFATPPSFWIVTRGAHSIDGSPARLSGAALWGLGRVVALEHPELWRGLIDLEPACEDEFAFLVQELKARGSDDQVAYRQGVRHVARVVRNAAKSVAADPEITADATYLITGGLGSLGLEVAGWMTKRGARNLVLVGRSMPSANALAAIGRMEQAGAKVMVQCGDVAETADCARIFGSLNGNPPLRGVIHAAGVLDDGVVYLQTAGRFRSVMAPKVAGSWNLHRLTQDTPLDFFVMFSSAASLLGSPGQSNYAAGNAFMDVLAHYRRDRGLPAISINWGPWGETGMAAELGKRSSRQWVPEGVTTVSPEQGLAVLGSLMRSGSAQLGVLNIDWAKFMSQLPDGVWPSVLSKVAPGVRGAHAERAGHGEPEFIRLLKELAPGERREAVIREVQAQVARVIGLEETELPDPEQGFFQMGLDSLMAIELKNYLGLSLGRTVPATVMFQFSNIAGLADYLLREAIPTESVATRPEANGTAKKGAPESSGNESDEELLALLAAEVAGIKQSQEGRGAFL